MPWTTVTNASTGDVLTASNFNNQVLGNLTALRGDFDFFRRTAGNITLGATTSWADLTTIGTTADLTLSASSGDLIEASIFLIVDGAANDLSFDVITVVGTTKTNSLTTGGAVPANWTAFNGSGWYAAGGTARPFSGSIFYVLQSGDISSSTVKLRMQYATSLATPGRLLFANTGNPMMFYARNHGPVQS